jgi:alkanesulfonate monooxygenase SsuD/methylene tetrahydromethanopterin reductase-like flavin-dependent oxidoreductase (luciferase family)
LQHDDSRAAELTEQDLEVLRALSEPEGEDHSDAGYQFSDLRPPGAGYLGRYLP